MSTAPDPGKKGGAVASGINHLPGIVASSNSSTLTTVSSSQFLASGSHISVGVATQSPVTTQAENLNVKDPSEHSGASDTPSKRILGSYTRSFANSKAYTVAEMAKILQNEFRGRTFYDVEDLPYILFPPGILQPFSFDQTEFVNPLSDYRLKHFRNAIVTVPKFLRGYFEQHEAYRVHVRNEINQYVYRIPEGHRFDVPAFSASNNIKQEAEEREEDLQMDDDDDDDKVTDPLESALSAGDETEMAGWFSNIIQSCFPFIHQLGARGFSADYYETPLTGKSPERRKPDLVLVDIKPVPRTDDWSSIRTVIEVSRSKKFPTRIRIEAAQRAALMLLNSPGRRFVPILLISDRQFMIVIFHRSGVSYSCKYDIVLHEYILIYILVNFAYANLEYLGYDRAITYGTNGQLEKIDFDGRILNILSNPAPFVREGITGRGTVCLAVEDPKTMEKLMVKYVWGELDDNTELNNYNEFAEDKITGVSVLIDHVDCYCGDPIELDSTQRWRPSNCSTFVVRKLRKLLIAGVGEPIANFRTKKELFYVMEDLVSTLIALRDAGFLHRDMTLRNIFLVKEYPQYPEYTDGSDQGTVDSPSSGSSKSIRMASPEVQQGQSDEETRYKGLISDFDHMCRTVKGALEAAKRNTSKTASDAQDNLGKLRTGDLLSMPIQVLLGYTQKGEKGFYHTVQMDIESLLFDVLYLAIHQAGPCGLERNFKAEDFPNVLGGSTDIPTKMWLDPNATFVQLGFNKGNSLALLKQAIFPWIHPYFNNMKPFFAEFVQVLFPPEMPEEHRLLHVCSQAKPEDILAVIRKYKDSVGETVEADPDSDSERLPAHGGNITIDDPFVDVAPPGERSDLMEF